MSCRARSAIALLSAMVATFLTLVATAAPAAADAAGPTDYRTSITGITPDEGHFTVEIIGGDSFIQLESNLGSPIEILGYQGEPYLRFRTDGIVEVNERSPARWINDDRYGDADVPDDADADATPEWVTVSDNGVYAWHDHRTHWMNEAKPPGATPGDVILEAVVPVEVDETRVEVAVQSVFQQPPPLWPAMLAGSAALGAAIFLTTTGWIRTWRGPITIATASVASVAGLWAYLSVPASTGPSRLLWILPIVALLSAVSATAWSHHSEQRPLAADGLLMFAGAELAVWSWQRWDAVTRAVIPSNAPANLDRMTIVATGVVGAATLSTLLYEQFRGERLHPEQLVEHR